MVCGVLGVCVCLVWLVALMGPVALMGAGGAGGADGPGGANGAGEGWWAPTGAQHRSRDRGVSARGGRLQVRNVQSKPCQGPRPTHDTEIEIEMCQQAGPSPGAPGAGNTPPKAGGAGGADGPDGAGGQVKLVGGDGADRADGGLVVAGGAGGAKAPKAVGAAKVVWYVVCGAPPVLPRHPPCSLHVFLCVGGGG